MRDRPVFDSTRPDDAPLTDDERARLEGGLRVLADARAHEDDVSDIDEWRR